MIMIDQAEHEAHCIQLAPFAARVAELRRRYGVGHAEAKQWALNEAHFAALVEPWTRLVEAKELKHA